MIVRTIHFPMHISQDNTDIQSVVPMCREHGIHLSVVVFGEKPPPHTVSMASTITSDLWKRELEQNEALLKKRVDDLKALLLQEGIPGDARGEFTESGMVEQRVGEHARFADLAVANRHLPESGRFIDNVVTGILFRSGKPLLLVPETAPPSLDFSTVMVAWDGDVQASRAISEALPIIEKASKVHVVCVDAEKTAISNSDEPGWDLATYLARHGIDIQVDMLSTRRDRRVPGTLEQHAREIGADLIVMGAYGHSRMRQQVFGGTTRRLLDGCQVPLFLAH